MPAMYVNRPPLLKSKFGPIFYFVRSGERGVTDNANLKIMAVTITAVVNTRYQWL